MLGTSEGLLVARRARGVLLTGTGLLRAGNYIAALKAAREHCLFNVALVDTNYLEIKTF